MKLATTKRSEVIRRFLLNAVKANSPHLIQDAMEAFGISRQSVHTHLSELSKLGFLKAEGHTRGRIYNLGVKRFHSGVFNLKGLQESDVYYRDFSVIFGDLEKNIESICHYGFTEMLNNAIDHSCGTQVNISAERDEKEINLIINDDGEGIFNHIARIMELQDPRESILELSKGKLTTDPDNHTGQGIFFTSRAFDKFAVISGDLVFSHQDKLEKDFLLHTDKNHQGTTVIMNLDINTHRTLRAVFDSFTGDEDEDYAFNKTVVPVRLALYEGEKLVSRSQAKRILNRVEKFKTVILDFEGVDFIGQAFADEVFRIFVKRNPQIELFPMNENEDIKRMIIAAANYSE